MSNNMRLILNYIFIIISSIACLQGCKEETYLDPYSGGKAALGVKFNNTALPVPAEGSDGATVTFQVTGLTKLDQSQIKFLFNGLEAQIIEVKDTYIKVKVPNGASTGFSSIAIQDQVFLGPKFKVLGKVDFDPELVVTTGANRPINDYYQLADGRMILVGGFTDYDHKGVVVPMGGIVRIREDGNVDNTFRPNGGADGGISNIAYSNNKYFVAGSFRAYKYNPGGTSINPNINFITRINTDGSLDSVKVNTYKTPETLKQKAVPSFNGGADATISQIYPYQGKIIAVGNFRSYVRRRYNQPTSAYIIAGQTVRYDTIIIDTTEIPQVMRLEEDGELDRTYRFDVNLNRGKDAGNGSIGCSYFHSDNGKLMLAGNFTKFDGNDVGRIVRLNADGTIDNSFSVGAGANGAIYAMYFNELTKKYFVAGSFTSFNNTPALGLAMLDEHGVVETSFSSKGFSNGYPRFIKQLSNNLIIVSGSFDTYGGARRPGLMILNPNGELAAGYNNMGVFNGSLAKVIEMKNVGGKLSLRLLGNFTQLNGTNLSHITQLTLEP